MIIKKFKLHSKFPEEYEFEVTRVRETKTIQKTTIKTDDNGNAIGSAYGNEEIKAEQSVSVNEGITAVSLPSREPAAVEILETAPSPGDQTVVEKEPKKSSSHIPKPVDTSQVLHQDTDRPVNIDLTKLLYGEGNKPIVIPKIGEITWADGSNQEKE